MILGRIAGPLILLLRTYNVVGHLPKLFGLECSEPTINSQQQLAMKTARARVAKYLSHARRTAQCAGARSPHGAHLERCSIRRLGRGFLPSGILRYEKFWWSVRHHSAIKQQKRKTEIFIFQNLPKFSVKSQQISANLGTNIYTLRSLKKIEALFVNDRWT